MFENYVIAFFRTQWALITNIATIVPGDLHYGRKVGSGSPFARFTLTTQKVETITEGCRHATYQITLNIISENTSQADLLTFANTLDSETSATSGLLGALKAVVGTAVSSGGGTPGGTLIGCWRIPSGAGDSLQTDDERRGQRDTHATMWSCKLMVQWP